MAFQGRHQTRSGLRKINSVLPEGKGQEGRLWSEGDWFLSAASHPLLPISSHGSAGSGCLLSTSAGVTNQGQRIKSLLLGTSFAARVLALSRLCPLRCRWGCRVSPHCRQGQEWPTLPGSVPRPKGDGGSLEGARLQGMWAQFGCPDGRFFAGGRGEVRYRPISLAALLGCLASPTNRMHHGIWLGGGGKVNNSNYFGGTEEFLGFTLLLHKCQ